MTVVPSMEEFVQKGKRIRAHRYLSETFVAFASDSTFTVGAEVLDPGLKALPPAGIKIRY